MRRFARMTLSLVIAYAIVLGGVAGASLGHAYGPAAEFCLSQPANADLPPDSDRHEPYRAHDCCPALCGGLAGLPSPPSAAGQAVRFFVTAAWSPKAWSGGETGYTQSHSARAPPAG